MDNLQQDVLRQVKYMEHISNRIIGMHNDLAELKSKLTNEEDLLEFLRTEMSSFVGENEIGIANFSHADQKRIERWITDY